MSRASCPCTQELPALSILKNLELSRAFSVSVGVSYVVGVWKGAALD